MVPTRNRARRVERCIRDIAAQYPVLVLGTSADDREEDRSEVWTLPDVTFLYLDYVPYAVLNLPTPHGDLAAKRNFGVRYAARRGFDSVVLLDDDIEVGCDVLQHMIGMLADYDLVGTTLHGRPDHSFLYSSLAVHERLSQFVSANCLAARIDKIRAFPTIYNEDWFAIFPALVAGRVAAVGRAAQIGEQSRPPTAARVRSEELGDLLAEGLLNALHVVRDASGPATGAQHVMADVLEFFHTVEYWDSRVDHRVGLYRRAIDVLLESRMPRDRRETNLALLRSGCKTLSEYRPSELARLCRTISSACGYA